MTSAPDAASGVDILLVEDAEADAEMLRRGLKRCLPGVVVRQAWSVHEALTELRGAGTLPDLLLLDLSLPDATGLSLLAAIRSDPCVSLLPVVVVSGTTRQSEVDAAYACGAHGFLVKPLAPEEMERLLGRVCDYWFGAVRRPRPGGVQR